MLQPWSVDNDVIKPTVCMQEQDSSRTSRDKQMNKTLEANSLSFKQIHACEHYIHYEHFSSQQISLITTREVGVRGGHRCQLKLLCDVNRHQDSQADPISKFTNDDIKPNS